MFFCVVGVMCSEGRWVAKPHTVPVRDWRTGLGAGTEAGLGTEFLAVTTGLKWTGD